MIAYTYTITIPTGSPPLPSTPTCSNAALGVFIDKNSKGHPPVNTTTLKRQFSEGDTFNFAISNLQTQQTASVKMHYDLKGAGVFPFTSSIPVSSGMVVYSNSNPPVNLSFMVDTSHNSTMSIWFVITLDNGNTYYVADPEVQTGTGSA